MNLFHYIFISLMVMACAGKEKEHVDSQELPYILVLGVAQDAGYPQIACQKTCCMRLTQNLEYARMVSSIALIDPISNESWVIDATPDFPEQTRLLSRHMKGKQVPDGVFLTHGHIGHYTGLMYLGKEALGAKDIPVYAMPRMINYLANNGPWSQLVALKNIELRTLKSDTTLVLSERLAVTPIGVPHRDEFTETVGFVIHSGNKKALFIPDIDKWEAWERSILECIREVEIALLDATFYKDGEISRAMSEVPHPFVEESMKLFNGLSESDKQKVHFIHFNHTNPLLIDGSAAQKEVERNGFRIARQGEILKFSE